MTTARLMPETLRLARESGDDVPADVRASLVRMGLVQPDTSVALTPFTGGVSSRILLVETPARRFCFKQALAKLNVAADWYAPVERNRAEARWIRAANAILPDIAPRVLAEDREAEALAMAYLEPADHPLWKAQLLAGAADPRTAAAAGRAPVPGRPALRS